MSAPDGPFRPHHPFDIRPSAAIVELDGEPWVSWSFPDSSYGTQASRVSTDGALDRFSDLALAGPEEFAAFFRRHGPFAVCEEHGLPFFHPIRSWGREGPRCSSRELARDSWAVSVHTLRAYVSEVAAVLEIVGQLRNGKLGRAGDWVALFEGPSAAFNGFEGLREYPDPVTGRYVLVEEIEDVALQRGVVARKISDYIELGGVRPKVEWLDKEPEVVMTSIGVFGLIAQDLFRRLTSLDGLVICSGCGRAYNPDRKPAKGRKNWCQDCRKAGAPNRYAQRARRRRMRKDGGGG